MMCQFCRRRTGPQTHVPLQAPLIVGSATVYRILCRSCALAILQHFQCEQYACRSQDSIQHDCRYDQAATPGAFSFKAVGQ